MAETVTPLSSGLNKPDFSTTLPAQQKEQIEAGLRILFKQVPKNTPLLLRRGERLYMPRADGRGAKPATRADVDQFITEFFNMVNLNEGEITASGKPKPVKYAAIKAATKSWLLESAPEFVPEYRGTVRIPTFLTIAGDEVGGEDNEQLYLLSTPGYDPASKLIYAPPYGLERVDLATKQFPSARAAYEFLRGADEKGWLADVCVGDAEDPEDVAANEAALLAAIVAPAIKHMMGGGPGILFWATDQSAGKTFLARCIQVAYSGQESSSSNWPASEPEREYKAANMLEGSPLVAIFDNVKTNISSGLLDQLITEQYPKLRNVGEGTKTYHNSATWCLTSNNPTLDIDAQLRFLAVRVRRSPSADTGEYAHSPMTRWIQQNRHRILAAIFQLVRAGWEWTDSDELQLESAPDWEKFPEWTDLVWRICKAAGVPGFLTRRSKDVACSLEDTNLAELWEELELAFPDGFCVEDMKNVIYARRNDDLMAYAHLPFLTAVNRDGQKVLSIDPREFGHFVVTQGSYNRGGRKIQRIGPKTRKKITYYKILRH